MPFDPNIVFQIKGLELPNQLAQHAQMQQIQANQRQAEVSQMQLEELKNDRMEMQQFQQQLAASGGNPDLNAYADMLMKSPKNFKTGIELKQKLKDQSLYENYLKSESGGGAPAMGVAPAPSMGAAPDMNIDAAPINAMASRPAAPVNALAPQPVAPVNALAPQPANNEQTILNKIRMLSASNDPRAKAEVDVLKAQLGEMSKVPSDVRTMQSLGYPLTKAGFAEYRDAQRQERMLTPAEEAQKVRIANASRAPVQPVAPTIAQIVDPNNPSQMITVDARRYQGGGIGSAGVLGVGGKEPGAAVRANKAEEGKTQLADDLANLRASFDTLNTMRAIPNTERNAASNIASSVAASRVGQLTGQAIGTEAQVERDVINSARSRLVNSIKNATGMSAQQLNSNVELQTMLKSISDPGQSYQSAIRIIDDIEQAYVKGAGMPKKNAPKTGVDIRSQADAILSGGK